MQYALIPETEIRVSRLCRGEYVLGAETIRATVIGAGCHSAQLSGSTVYHQNIRFPLKNASLVAVSFLFTSAGPFTMFPFSLIKCI